MRPVIEKIINKNGEEEVHFNASPKMILFSIYRGRNPALTDLEVCKLCGLHSDLPTTWSRKYGQMYLDWLDSAVDGECGQEDAAVLERVGMINATQKGGYSYWKDMARKHGVIKDEVKETKVTINTDFTAILAMGDLDAARRRILQELRGVEFEGGSGVVDVTPIRELEGARSGTSQVQEGSMVLAHPLGSDRGRSEQGASLPALSQQDSPASSYSILDEGNLSAGTQESPDDLYVAVQRPVPARLNVLSVEDDDLSM